MALIGLSVLPFLALGVTTTVFVWNRPAVDSFTLSYGGACDANNFYFLETDANTALGDPDEDGNWSRVRPASNRTGSATSKCQSNTLAPLLITNTGSISFNVDGNFTSAFSGTDTNLALKVWMGTGAGCGADGNGFGGWQQPCTVTGSTSPVTQTTCRDYNSGNAASPGRIANTLAPSDSNQVCVSGETVQGLQTPGGAGGTISSGDHNKSFGLGT